MKQLFLILILFNQLAQAQDYNAFFDATAKEENHTATTTITNTIVPFTMIEGMMVVEAFVNEVKGNFIIDTGAPTLVLNEVPKNNKQNGRGISEGLATDEISVRAFSWSSIQKKDLPAFKVDISHLEQVSNTEIAGIIGYDILKDISLLVNYTSQTVQISPTNLKPNQQPLATIPFTMQGHLPVIKVKIGKKKLRLALDTASESNILDQKFLKKIAPEQIIAIMEGEMQGVDQKIKAVNIASISGTSVKGRNLADMNYLFTDLSHLKSESNLYIDGLLGYPFFKQGQISINYQEKKLYIWDLEEIKNEYSE